MANDRLIIECRHCGETWVLGKYYPARWTFNAMFQQGQRSETQPLDLWMLKHASTEHREDEAGAVDWAAFERPFAVYQEDGEPLPGHTAKARP